MLSVEKGFFEIEVFFLILLRIHKFFFYFIDAATQDIL